MTAEAPEPKRWHSIPEAAEYLEVSEPTLFRWMRAGQISFHKVGGSTRFTREALDAVVEKNTSVKEAEGARARCVACGHSVLVEGRLQGAGKLYFKPEKTKFFVFAESLVEMKARACAACGYVQLHTDTTKLKRLKPEA